MISGYREISNPDTIVLDLDETVCKAYVYSSDKLADLQAKVVDTNPMVFDVHFQDLTKVKFIICPRPGYRKFINNCYKNFKTVCVWTASAREYAHEVVNILFPVTPEIFYTRDDSINVRGSIHKDFHNLKRKLGNAHITMIDDKLENCISADKYLHIRRYSPYARDTELHKFFDA